MIRLKCCGPLLEKNPTFYHLLILASECIKLKLQFSDRKSSLIHVLSMQGKISEDNILTYCFCFFFSEKKKQFQFYCTMSLMVRSCLTCQTLFSEKKKKKKYHEVVVC